MKLKPLKDRVVIEFSEEPEKTAGGLYVPDSAKEKPQEGKIVAVGSEVKELKVGNNVIFDRYTGSKIKRGEKDFLIVKEEDILAVIE